MIYPLPPPEILATVRARHHQEIKVNANLTLCPLTPGGTENTMGVSNFECKSECRNKYVELFTLALIDTRARENVSKYENKKRFTVRVK